MPLFWANFCESNLGEIFTKSFAEKNGKDWLMGKNFGGYLFFAPVWIFGIIVIVINLINFFVNKSAW